MRKSTIASAYILLSVTGAMAQSTEAQIAEGKKLAFNLCSACHIVSVEQTQLPVLQQSTPFFFEMANNPKTTPQSLAAYLEQAHYDFKSRPVTMPAQTLSTEEKRDIIAYIMSLRRVSN